MPLRASAQAERKQNPQRRLAQLFEVVKKWSELKAELMVFLNFGKNPQISH